MMRLGRRLASFEIDRLEALRSARELTGWTETDLRSLLPHVDEVILPAGARLAVAGQPATLYAIVVTGRLGAACAAGMRALGPGDGVGWEAMWTRGLNPATITVEEEATLLVMSHAQFRAVKALAPAPAASSVGLDEVGGDQLPAAV